MANANNKVKMKLDGLAKRNRNSNYVNKDLYRMLYNEEMFVMAYETIRPNKGVGTKGSAKKSIDGFTMDKIRKIIDQLRNGSFKPRPCRRTYIPKANGKMRPLGLPDFEEKLVQQCVTRILECIYDNPYKSTFVNESHGFRAGRSCHSALKMMKEHFSGVNYVIKADVKGFFDNVDHHVLVDILRKRIKDERFIQLIWKFLRAGIMIEDDDGDVFIKGKRYKYQKTLLGTPQGGIVSPILANIYLHEFDCFVEKLRAKHYKDPIVNPAYNYANNKRRKYRKLLKKSAKDSQDYAFAKLALSAYKKEQDQTDSMKYHDVDNNLFHLRYNRYADDWMLGVKGTIKQAEYVYDKCKTFFKDELKLDWSESKSYLKRSYDQAHDYLGVDVCFTKPRQVRHIYMWVNGSRVRKRTAPKAKIYFRLPTQKIVNRLYQKGYLKLKKGKFVPTHQSLIVNRDNYEIALHYQSVNNGITNYYRFVHNVHALNYVQYILKYSMIKTLARKEKSSVRKIIKKYGNPSVIWRGDKKKSITFPKEKYLKFEPTAFKYKGLLNWNAIFFKGMDDTKSYIREEGCCICPSTDRVQIHHVRHIKRQGVKYQGFNKIMGAINRKQIPVCHKCHWKIHNGHYDGVDLKVMANTIMGNLGIIKHSDKG